MKIEKLLGKAKINKYGSLRISRINGEFLDIKYDVVINDVIKLVEVLRLKGLRRGQLVGLQLPNCYEFILWDLASLEMGFVLQVLPEDVDFKSIDSSISITDFALFIHANSSLCRDVDSDWVWDVYESNKFFSGRINHSAVVLEDNDILTRVYSSGSSGYFKGLNISRSGTESLISDFIRDFEIDSTDKHLLFLPLSNYQQRMSVYACLYTGASLTVILPGKIFQMLRKESPTFIIAPPAIYENIFSIFRSDNDSPYRVSEFLGGEIRFMITGMAPIQKEILRIFNTKFNQLLLEVYGATETGMIAWNTAEKNKIGTVGKLINDEHVILRDDGEVSIRKPKPLTKGYFFCRDGDNAKTFLSDGSILTGDIAELDNDGFLILKGRKKEIIITDGGRKIHPEEIERELSTIEDIRHVVIFWSEIKRQIVPVIAIDDISQLQVMGKIKADLTVYNRNAKQSRKVSEPIFTDMLFNIESGFLTRNLKFHRGNIYKNFSEEIKAV